MAKVKSAKNEVALLDDGSVDSVDVMAGLKKELKEIKDITETQYKTNGIIEGISGSIHNETTISKLIVAYGSVIAREDIYNRAQKEMSDATDGALQAPVFCLGGSKAADLKYDIIHRAKVLSVDKRKKEIEDVIKEGEKFLTEKDQKKIWLNKVMRVTGKIADDTVDTEVVS